MSFAENSTKLAERVLALAGIIGSTVFVGIMAYEVGHANGKDSVNRNLWENPPGMSSCRVYPDGGKQCQKAWVAPEPMTRTECVRQCVMRSRLEKTGS